MRPALTQPLHNGAVNGSHLKQLTVVSAERWVRTVPKSGLGTGALHRLQNCQSAGL